MKVKVGVSNRHIHLTKEDFKILFNEEELSVKNYLVQKEEFASNHVVTIMGNKGMFENVRVVGPFRSYTQVEVSKTDCYTLGIDAPIRDSGDLNDACEIEIVNKDKKIIRKCCIIPTRHIHINKKEQEQYNLYNSCYKVKISGEKGGILENVKLKVADNSSFELHLDTDDANSHLLKTLDEVEIID